MFLSCCSPRSSKTKGSQSRTWSWTVLETSTPPASASASIRAALDDHIAEVDADAQFDAAVRRDTGVPLGHRLLHFDRAAHRIDDAGKFHQQAVAGGLDDAPVVLGDLRIDKFAPQRLEAFERTFLVRLHQPRIPRHIGGEDRGETASGSHARAPFSRLD